MNTDKTLMTHDVVIQFLKLGIKTGTTDAIGAGIEITEQWMTQANDRIVELEQVLTRLFEYVRFIENSYLNYKISHDFMAPLPTYAPELGDIVRRVLAKR